MDMCSASVRDPVEVPSNTSLQPSVGRTMNRVLYAHKWITLREGLHGEAYIDGGRGVVVVPVLDSGMMLLTRRL
jgi:hypothetical protein